jgi:prepilin signal peptidase PulO-like enzyme (type II secretory pathway)
MLVLISLAAGVVFAAFAVLGTYLARPVIAGVRPFDDGPIPGRPSVIAIGAAAAALGICAAARGTGLPELGMCAVLTVVLAAICYADVRCGLVPDVFTLVPLAAILAGDALLHRWTPLVAVALVAGPFCLAASFSKGRGMGWGDVKLVALGAAVLGAQPALLAFTGACFLAVAVATLRRRQSSPIAFAPYLAASVAVVVAAHGVG